MKEREMETENEWVSVPKRNTENTQRVEEDLSTVRRPEKRQF